MLNKLKKEIEARSFKHHNKIKIVGIELIVSANLFSGYELLLELDAINKMIDTKIYRVEYLNNNVISIGVKRIKKGR